MLCIHTNDSQIVADSPVDSSVNVGTPKVLLMFINTYLCCAEKSQQQGLERDHDWTAAFWKQISSLRL